MLYNHIRRNCNDSNEFKRAVDTDRPREKRL